MKPPFYQITQETDSAPAELYILGYITDEQATESDTSPKTLTDQLAALNVPALDVYIDSYGGSVSAGWTLYNTLRQFAARKSVPVTTHGMGFVASAALFPFMAGSRRIAHNPSAYFFHNAAALAAGYASDLRKAADELDKVTEIGITAFTDNTSLTAADVKALMDAETWLSPSEALENGIATAFLTESPEPGVQQSARNAVFDRILASRPAPPSVPRTAFQRLRKIYNT